jgi:hypothetical protein
LDLDLRPLAEPTLAVVAVVYGVLWLIASHAGLFGLPLMVLLFFSGARYGYAVLRAVAQGRRTIPPPDIESMNPVNGFRTVLHSTFFGGALVASIMGSSLLGSGLAVDAVRFAAALVLACIYPASAALLALNGDLQSAMNPRHVLSIVTTLGRRYAFVLVTWAALALALGLFVRLPWPPLIAVPLEDMATVWVGLAVFALIGSALRTHRHLLDIPGEIETVEEIRERERRREWQGFLDRAYASIRSGFPAQGYRTITDLLESEGRSLAVQQWVFERMLGWEDRTHALAFATRLVEALLEQGQEYDALEIVTRCRRVPGALALEPAVAARVAEFARSIGRDGIADELMESVRASP